VLISKGARAGDGLVEGILPADQNTISDMLQQVKKGARGVGACNPGLGIETWAPDSGAGQELPPIVIGQDLAESLGAEVAIR